MPFSTAGKNIASTADSDTEHDHKKSRACFANLPVVSLKWMLEATKRGCNSWKWYCRKAKCSAQPAKTVNHNFIDDNLPSSTISPRNAMRSSPLSECNSPIKSQSISLFLTISTKSNYFSLTFRDFGEVGRQSWAPKTRIFQSGTAGATSLVAKQSKQSYWNFRILQKNNSPSHLHLNS